MTRNCEPSTRVSALQFWGGLRETTCFPATIQVGNVGIGRLGGKAPYPLHLCLPAKPTLTTTLCQTTYIARFGGFSLHGHSKCPLVGIMEPKWKGDACSVKDYKGGVLIISHNKAMGESADEVFSLLSGWTHGQMVRSP